jgi:peptidoglycan hydrolase-like protein with peptidoglycan-binding domain
MRKFFYCVTSRTVLLLVVSCWLSVGIVDASIARTLSLGSQGADVKELQVILNSDTFTQVATGGAGSPGQENGYFGPLTKKAVMNFQRKYAPEVLFPAGIWQPTGVVGKYTIAKLNSLSSGISGKNAIVSFDNIPALVQSVVPPITVSSTPVDLSQNKTTTDFYNFFASGSKPLLFNLSAYQAKHGDKVTVNGNGFLSTDNSVIFGSNSRIDNLTSAIGTSITFTIPDSVPNGSYNLAVENKNGSTFDTSYGDFFKITDTPTGPPAIFKVDPPVVSSTDTKTTITLTGENFDKDNDIFSSLGNLSNVSSDGRTITFSLSSLEHTSTLVSTVKIHPISVPIYLFVKNSYGVTLTPQKVIIDFK